MEMEIKYLCSKRYDQRNLYTFKYHIITFSSLIMQEYKFFYEYLE